MVCRLFIHLEVNQELFKEKYQTFTFRDPSLKLGPEICEMGLWPILPVVGCKEVATSCSALKLSPNLTELVPSLVLSQIWLFLGQCKHRYGPCDRYGQLNNFHSRLSSPHQGLLSLISVRWSRWNCLGRKTHAIQNWRTRLMTPNPFLGKYGWYCLYFGAEGIGPSAFQRKLVDLEKAPCRPSWSQPGWLDQPHWAAVEELSCPLPSPTNHVTSPNPAHLRSVGRPVWKCFQLHKLQSNSSRVFLFYIDVRSNKLLSVVLIPKHWFGVAANK